MSIPIVFIGLLGTYALCSNREICIDYSHSFFLQFLPMLPVSIVCLFLLFQRTEIYESWFRFARWWIPLSMILIFISPEYPQGIYDPIQKGSVALVMSVLFVAISIVIITIKYFSVKKRSR